MWCFLLSFQRQVKTCKPASLIALSSRLLVNQTAGKTWQVLESKAVVLQSALSLLWLLLLLLLLSLALSLSLMLLLSNLVVVIVGHPPVSLSLLLESRPNVFAIVVGVVAVNCLCHCCCNCQCPLSPGWRAGRTSPPGRPSPPSGRPHL